SSMLLFSVGEFLSPPSPCPLSPKRGERGAERESPIGESGVERDMPGRRTGRVEVERETFGGGTRGAESEGVERGEPETAGVEAAVVPCPVPSRAGWAP